MKYTDKNGRVYDITRDVNKVIEFLRECGLKIETPTSLNLSKFEIILLDKLARLIREGENKIFEQ